MSTVVDLEQQRVRALLVEVCDPELPGVTIEELGVLRDVAVTGDGVVVTITPTYSGCPAMSAISDDIKRVLEGHGFAKVSVATELAPAWSSTAISHSARQKLSQAGIAPPLADCVSVRGGTSRAVPCPLCGSSETERVSEFGSTACKALHRCRSCLEPFDYFKCI